jgi:uncharacterized membrane protein YjgN (DUF898 family)
VDATANDSALPAAAIDARPRAARVEFIGTGEEYFRIWIFNTLLTIATLGIYSAWAKVRKLQYFYRSTRLDGSVFDYHGDPVAILKGRILAVGMVALYQLAVKLTPTLALVVALGVVVVLPWMLAQSYRFRLHNSSYRGLRFRFGGPVWQAYLFFGVPIFLIVVPGALAAFAAGDRGQPDPRLLIGTGVVYLLLTLLWPYLHFSFKRWQHAHAQFGTARGHFEARAGDFYGTYVAAAAMLLFFSIPTGFLMAAIGAGLARAGARAGLGFGFSLASGVVFYASLVAVESVVAAWIQNTVWSKTRLGGVGFACDVRAGRLIGITLSNLVMIVVSLGFLIPFALVRTMKYKIESIQVLDADALTQFIGEGEGTQVGTAGEGLVDVMDLDFGL